MDTESNSSVEELIQYRDLEKTIGFKPNPTRNYLFTTFNRTTKVRTLLFDGAYPLHNATNYFEEFFNLYVNKSKKNTVYQFSVILDTKNMKKETDTHILCKLEPNISKTKRIKSAKICFKKLVHIFDSIYDSYIPKSSEKKKLEREYRKYISFRQFVNSKNYYFEQQKNIKKMLKMGLMDEMKEIDNGTVVNEI